MIGGGDRDSAHNKNVGFRQISRQRYFHRLVARLLFTLLIVYTTYSTTVVNTRPAMEDVIFEVRLPKGMCNLVCHIILPGMV